MGASSTSTPLRRASRPSRAPIASIRAGSQVAANPVAEGTLAELSRSSQDWPRTPAGPSESTIGRSPASGSS